MDPSKEETYKWVEGFLEEMSSLFVDKFFHIGGDEVFRECWANEKMWQRLRNLTTPVSHPQEAQKYFNNRIFAMLEKLGKFPVGWDEITVGGLSKDTVIHSWRGLHTQMEADRQGYRSILSSGFYLDAMDSSKRFLGRQVLPDSALHLGGESCMWAEYIDEHRLFLVMFPRAAMIGAKFWGNLYNPSGPEVHRRQVMISRMQDFNGVPRVAFHFKKIEHFLLQSLNEKNPTEELVNNVLVLVMALLPGHRGDNVNSVFTELNELVISKFPS